MERLKANHPGTGRATLGWRFLEKIVQLPLSLPRPGPGQAKAYLDSLFGDAPATSLTGADQDQVKQLTQSSIDEISSQPTSLEELPQRIRAVQPAGVSQEVLREVRQRVLERVFDRFVKDSDPLVREMVSSEALELPSCNPREIKRLLNLFRFYALIAARRRLLDPDNEDSQREVLRLVARLAALSIQWPFLLDTLATPAESLHPEQDDPRPPIRLEELELAAMDDSRWSEAMINMRLGVPATGAEQPEPPSWASELRKFLRRQPKLGRFAREFL